MENLADMGSIPAIARRACAHNPRLQHHDTSDSLYGHAFSPNLPGVDSSQPRNVDPAQAQSHERQFALLAQLVASVEPANSDRIAFTLLQTFGTLARIFSAPIGAVEKASSNTALAALIATVRPVVMESLRVDLTGKDFGHHEDAFARYLVARMQCDTQEHFDVVFLDRQRRFIIDDRLASGSHSMVSIALRPLMRKAIELDASWLVLCHNHPSGSARPSQADLHFTAKTSAIGEALGIGIWDHIIVAGADVFSMRKSGMLK